LAVALRPIDAERMIETAILADQDDDVLDRALSLGLGLGIGLGLVGVRAAVRAGTVVAVVGACGHQAESRKRKYRTEQGGGCKTHQSDFFGATFGVHVRISLVSTKSSTGSTYRRQMTAACEKHGGFAKLL